MVRPTLVEDSYIKMYPPAAYASQQEGTVKILVEVGEQGGVNQVKVAKSSGYPILDTAAVKMAQTFRFTRSMPMPEGQSCWISQSVVYSLNKKTLNYADWYQKAIRLQFDTNNRLVENPYAQAQLLAHYLDLANSVAGTRDLDANKTILKTISPELKYEWEQYAREWPLHYLLFADFLYRVPDSHQAALARDFLNQCIAQEVDQLQNPPQRNMRKSPAIRDELISKISGLQQDIVIGQIY